MDEPRAPHEAPSTDEQFGDEIDRRARRKLRARREGRPNVWFSLGMIGLVGWSVAVPTLAGIAIGVWIDYNWPGRMSWTLTLLFAGAALGCLNAWRWVRQESSSGGGEGGGEDVGKNGGQNDSEGD